MHSEEACINRHIELDAAYKFSRINSNAQSHLRGDEKTHLACIGADAVQLWNLLVDTVNGLIIFVHSPKSDDELGGDSLKNLRINIFIFPKIFVSSQLNILDCPYVSESIFAEPANTIK
uniref:Uncharacterized protein n=1 Tax=Schistocephalus solidus TaxID=70667 RepID=A0A0X3PYA6_SCHSO